MLLIKCLKKKNQTNHQMITFYWYNSTITYECDIKIANKQASNNHKTIFLNDCLGKMWIYIFTLSQNSEIHLQSKNTYTNTERMLYILVL